MRSVMAGSAWRCSLAMRHASLVGTLYVGKNVLRLSVCCVRLCPVQWCCIVTLS